jgi:Tol biopolymer transport system component
VTEGKGEKWSPRWLGPDRIGYSSGGPERDLEFTKGTAGARGEFNSPEWSPHRLDMVYYRDMGQNWPPVVETHSCHPQFRLLRTGIFPSASPAGDRLPFTTGLAALTHNGLMEASIDGSNRWLIHDDLEHNTVAPAWSPLGDRIAFGSGGAFQGSVGVGRQVSNIAVVSPDGSGFKLLTEGSGNNGFPSWSPDGHRIVFQEQDQSGKGLRILDVDTGKITTLTEGNNNNDNFPSWSPKRRRDYIHQRS